MNTVDLAQLPLWADRAMWVLARVVGLCLAAPVFGSSVVPVRVRVAVAVLLGLALLPLAPGTVDPLSAAGVATLAGQVLIGATIGFVLWLAFQAVAYGGQLVAQTMGLGFAETIDPSGGGSSPTLGQFYLALVTLLFLAMDGHLRLVALLAESFRQLPPGAGAVPAAGLHAVAAFAGALFLGAVRVALPALTALLVVNMGFAAISRAAPSMNLFAVGFPITLCLGFMALWLSLRSLPGAFEAVLDRAWALMRALAGG
ncbi:flagellar biosynthetic protein FliR [Fulvimonas sp. R45]|uniref:flagellar biosynthetic protein FliR n=1 Tax=Fulvimonas sp. R45 TaxID=3045937 RepID=UPI00266021C6|nr:flagellar biosynthetic protein FliR [Fulvimonas sp. R45]MDO1528365.1 flagellar biosynthetic protein FliR [Fulvimonas sp. R45]